MQTRLKYAKWKAVEIDRCLKTGITPTPGPPGGDEGGAFNLGDLDANLGGGGGSFDMPPPQSEQPSYPTFPTPSIPAPTPIPDLPKPVAKPRHLADPKPAPIPQAQAPVPQAQAPVPQAQISCNDVSRAQKLCKFASSALDYEDVAGAVDFLQKAINLLKTGKEGE